MYYIILKIFIYTYIMYLYKVSNLICNFRFKLYFFPSFHRKAQLYALFLYKFIIFLLTFLIFLWIITRKKLLDARILKLLKVDSGISAKSRRSKELHESQGYIMRVICFQVIKFLLAYTTENMHTDLNLIKTHLFFKLRFLYFYTF